jgi:hypothetical protein
LENAKVPTGQFPSALAAAERWCQCLRSDIEARETTLAIKRRGVEMRLVLESGGRGQVLMAGIRAAPGSTAVLR